MDQGTAKVFPYFEKVKRRISMQQLILQSTSIEVSGLTASCWSSAKYQSG